MVSVTVDRNESASSVLAELATCRGSDEGVAPDVSGTMGRCYARARREGRRLARSLERRWWSTARQRALAWVCSPICSPRARSRDDAPDGESEAPSDVPGTFGAVHRVASVLSSPIGCGSAAFKSLSATARRRVCAAHATTPPKAGSGASSWRIPSTFGEVDRAAGVRNKSAAIPDPSNRCGPLGSRHNCRNGRCVAVPHRLGVANVRECRSGGWHGSRAGTRMARGSRSTTSHE